MPFPPTFLGFDLSTQGLKAIVIARGLQIVHESFISFDRDLPHYKTTNGTTRGPNGEVTSPVAMWLEAFDILFQGMKDAGVEFGTILGVSGAGQQHGSVYWSGEGPRILAALDPAETLHAQLSPGAFSLPNAPIWQDSSTTSQCIALQDSVGGAQRLADLSGSRAYERFTGPQIAKVYNSNRKAYDATAHISLVSSWMASLFLGKIAPIEVSDASGMNLMNVVTLKWEDELLNACGGPDLRSKIGDEPVAGGSVLGKISSWWVERWGLNEDCLVAPFTGDNPATVAGLSTPGDAILSLGTSTTLLLAIPPAPSPPKRFTTSHLLAHPSQAAPPAYIAMLCYKNGALAREEIRDKYCSSSWDKYNQHVESTSPGNDGYSGLYFPLHEIIPPNVRGEFFFKDGEPIDSIPDSHHARAILESQLLSIKSRIISILSENTPPLKRLIITGGSSANKVFRQVAADIFGLDVYVAETKEATAIGGALLAQFAWWRATQKSDGTYEELKANDAGEKLTLVARPRTDQVKLYEGLLGRYTQCEEYVVNESTRA